MPRNEQREVKFSRHALTRATERAIALADAEHVIRHGATRPDADCDFIASGTVGGRYIEAACLDKGTHILVKTVY